MHHLFVLRGGYAAALCHTHIQHGKFLFSFYDEKDQPVDNAVHHHGRVRLLFDAVERHHLLQRLRQRCAAVGHQGFHDDLSCHILIGQPIQQRQKHALFPSLKNAQDQVVVFPVSKNTAELRVHILQLFG